MGVFPQSSRFLTQLVRWRPLRANVALQLSLKGCKTLTTMTSYEKPEAKVLQELKDIANKLRIHAITSTNVAGSGHPSSCSSIAEILSVLFFHEMHYKVSAPLDASSDRFVLSKGHAAPILYAAWAEVGLFPIAKLADLRKIDSNLEGHPTPRLNFIDVGTGSLGQGLSIAAGMAYVGKNYDKASYRVYCLVGDGESAEGAIWEAINFAGHYNLSNLCLIIDVNRLGQSEETSLGHDTETYCKRLEAFGMDAIIVDGHSVEDLLEAFHVAANDNKGRPTALICKTFKGRNFPKIEDQDDWHGKPLGGEAPRVIEYLKSLIRNPGELQLQPKQPRKNDAPMVSLANMRLSSPPAYKLGEEVATRLAYGKALAKLAECSDRVIALDGDMKNSTHSEEIKKVDPSRFIECYIAEQNMVGVAIGAACRDRTVAFVSTFVAFLTRAYDQIRMGAISHSNVNFVGTHCGVSVGEDGPSQMGMEDIAMFRSIPTCTIFYPLDAVACERAVELAANTKGMTYIRTNRPATKVVYSNDFEFQIGKANVLVQSEEDQALLISGGITLEESLSAAERLKCDGISVRVLDPFTIKPLDEVAVQTHAAECGGRVVVVEDHYAPGGLGEVVMSAVSGMRNVIISHLAVNRVPRSGPTAALLDHYGISSCHIVDAVKEIIAK